MRYEKGHKDAIHNRIVKVAAKRIRGEGIGGAGIAGIMAEAGLTNGAFYAHFDSKDEMVKESIERATDEQWASFEKGLASDGLMSIVKAYLSEQHRDHSDVGCPSAALLPEISRQVPATRLAYTRSVERLIGSLEKQFVSTPKGPRRRQLAIGCFGLVVGVLQVARAVDDPALSSEILASGIQVAEHLLRAKSKVSP